MQKSMEWQDWRTEGQRERKDSIRDDERAFLLCGHSVFPYHRNTDMI